MDVLNIVTSWIGPLATLGIAICAYYSLKLTRSMFFHQGAPKIIVYAKEDSRRPGWMVVCVQNIGNDIGLNIKLKTDRVMKIEGDVVTSGPLIEGITLLAPGDSREYLWGSYSDVVQSVGVSPIDVTVDYTHRIEDGKEGTRNVPLTVQSKLDIRSFEGTQISRDPGKTMEDHLGNISASVEKIADNNPPSS